MIFVNFKSKALSSLVLLLTIPRSKLKLVLVVSLMLLFLVHYLALNLAKHFPLFLTRLTTLSRKLKSPVQIILTFSFSSFCVRYCCDVSNTV